MLTTEKYEMLVELLLDVIKDKNLDLYLNKVTIKDLEEKLAEADKMIMEERECLQNDNPHY